MDQQDTFCGISIQSNLGVFNSTLQVLLLFLVQIKYKSAIVH